MHRAERSHHDVLEALLGGVADVATIDKHGWTAEECHADVAAMLLRKGGDVAAMDEYGRTALHWAAD